MRIDAVYADLPVLTAILMLRIVPLYLMLDMPCLMAVRDVRLPDGLRSPVMLWQQPEGGAGAHPDWRHGHVYPCSA